MMRKIKKILELLHDRRRVNLQNHWVRSKVYGTTPLDPDLPPKRLTRCLVDC